MKILRINNVIKKMREDNLNQILVTSPESIFYLTGKLISPGQRFLGLYVDSNGGCKLINNKLFPTDEVNNLEILWYSDIENPIDKVTSIVKKNETLGVDKNLKAHFLIDLMNRNVVKNFVNSSPIIDTLRMIKDSEEIELMKMASKINDKTMLQLWDVLKTEKSEKYYVNILQELFESNGASGFSFSPIIAIGPNAANPHHKPSKSIIKKGDSLVIDMGCVYENYCSDMTRTIFIGETPDEEKANVHNIVRNANEKAISIIKEGVKFSDIDKAARDFIKEAGFGEYFTHRTGHSIGIEVHDFGNVSSVNDDIVKSGMIFSIEPGIYLKDNIGVRIEDLVLVTKDGCEVLNSVTKDIVVL